MRKLVSLSILSVFVMSCASLKPNQTTQAFAEEPIRYIDLTADSKKDLIERYWVVIKSADPKYPVDAARRGLSGCVDFIVAIDSNGTLGGFKIKKSYPEGVFDKSAAAALNRWKWSASKDNIENTPVLTTTQLNFMVSNSKNKAETEKQCDFSHI
ncbi:hypothetical protein A6F57_18330 [Alteromonas stellipolaris]|uniref:energy transducer TonB n=1 Tax=Alteromonas stellipolaris TaxID=233316 RepID=UPI0007B44FB4|nr:energy transducer TonB [Alteromonas stellipolaris]ANB26959.1 hypothetical protein A6F57_18330 [Alteromonas stellipolaris]